MASATGIPERRSCTGWATGRPKPADPYNDYEPVDASASAIAAQGLLRLGHLLGAAGEVYTQAGLTVAARLLQEPYLSVQTRARRSAVAQHLPSPQRMGLHSPRSEGSLRRSLHVGRLPSAGALPADHQNCERPLLHLFRSGWMHDQERVALVTGGTRGIGLGIALKLAEAGFTLAISGRRPAEQVQPVLEQIRQAQQALHLCAGGCGVGGRPAVAAWRCRRPTGQAGCSGQQRGHRAARPRRSARCQRGELRRTDRDQSARALFSDPERCRLDDPATRQGPSAKRSIINISSVSATVASVNRGDYCISKAGIAMATKLWAVRLAEYGIGVYEVRPGIIETDMTEGVKGKYDALIEGGILLEKRWGTPEDIGTAVSMLARGELPYATGAVLVLDGGLTMARLLMEWMKQSRSVSDAPSITSTAEAVSPRWGFAVSSGILGWILDAFDFFVLVFLVDVLANNFHVRKGDIVWTITITLAMRPVGAVVLGSLADRYGRRRPLIACVLYFSIITALTPFAPSYCGIRCAARSLWNRHGRVLGHRRFFGHGELSQALARALFRNHAGGLFRGISAGCRRSAHHRAPLRVAVDVSLRPGSRRPDRGAYFAVARVLVMAEASPGQLWRGDPGPLAAQEGLCLPGADDDRHHLSVPRHPGPVSGFSEDGAWFSNAVISNLAILYNVGAIVGALVIGHYSDRAWAALRHHPGFDHFCALHSAMGLRIDHRHAGPWIVR